ncbi:hypothetical protein VE26_16800, partial [Devosia chinhatensis]
SLMGVLHETGHALSEQGLPTDWSHWPLGTARGMGMHQRPSLFVELQIARSADFCESMLPLMHHHLGADAIAGWHIDDILAEVTFAEPGYIAVYAAGGTYPLRGILRSELEQELVPGRTSASQLPAIWHAKVTSHLGLLTLHAPPRHTVPTSAAP